MSSCGIIPYDTLQNVSIAGGTAAAAHALEQEPVVVAAAGAVGYIASNESNKQRKATEEQNIKDAEARGRQQVMLDTYHGLQASQGGPGYGSDGMYHEVVIPTDAYTNNDGIRLEAHDKVILTR